MSGSFLRGVVVLRVHRRIRPAALIIRLPSKHPLSSCPSHFHNAENPKCRPRAFRCSPISFIYVIIVGVMACQYSNRRKRLEVTYHWRIGRLCRRGAHLAHRDAIGARRWIHSSRAPHSTTSIQVSASVKVQATSGPCQRGVNHL